MKKYIYQLVMVLIMFFAITISTMSQGTWENYTKDNVLLSHRIQSVMEDSKGNMWIGTLKGLHKYDGEDWQTFTKKEGLPHNSVTYLFEDSQGIVWIGTLLGLSKMEDGKLTTLGKKEGYPKYSGANYIFEDSKKRLWIGSGGVLQYENNQWTAYTEQNDAIYKSGVHLILEDPDGGIWVATAKVKGGGMWGGNTDVNDGGISRYDGETWHVFTEKDGLLAPNRCIFKPYLIDRHGNIWLGSCHVKGMAAGFKGVGSLMKYDGETWTSYSNKEDIVDDCVEILLEDSKGNIWVGTHRGVSVFDGASWKNYSQEDTLSDNQIRVIEEDSKGNIWIGTENGLCVFDGSEWKILSEGKELPDKFISAIHEDKNGNIWVGTGAQLSKGGGLSKFDGTSWTIYTEEDKLVGKLVYRIHEDSKGNIWFVTLTGISKYSPEGVLSQSLNN